MERRLIDSFLENSRVHDGKRKTISEIKSLLVKEIAEANMKGEDTSRMTRIFNKIESI